MKDYKKFIPKTAKLTAADYKFIEAVIVPKITTAGVIVNMFSGHQQVVNPIIKALHDFVMKLSLTDFDLDVLIDYDVSFGSRIQKFDRARYIIMKLDKQVYYNFID